MPDPDLPHLPPLDSRFVLFLVALLLGVVVTAAIWYCLEKLVKRPNKQQLNRAALHKELVETRRELAQTRALMIELLDKKQA